MRQIHDRSETFRRKGLADGKSQTCRASEWQSHLPSASLRLKPVAILVVGILTSSPARNLQKFVTILAF